MTPVLNGRELDSIALPAEPGLEQTIPLPASQLKQGSNTLEFRYEEPGGVSTEEKRYSAKKADKARLYASAAWGHLAIRGAVPRPEPESDCHWRGRSLCLPLGSRTDFFLRPDRSVELRVDGMSAWGKVAEESLAVTVEATDAQGRELDSARWIADEQPNLRLESDTGPISIAFSVDPSSDASRAARGVKLLAPRLLAVEETLDTAAERDPVPVPAADHPDRPNVLLYVVDSLRTDRLGVYGYDRPTSPHLDALATDGVVFENARAHSSWTRPTMASVMTGLHPGTHGAARNLTRLPQDVPVLAEYLSAAGYRTAAVVTNSFVSKKYGFGSGLRRLRAPGGRKSNDGGRSTSTAEAVNLGRPFAGSTRTGRTERPFLPLAAHDLRSPRALRSRRERMATRLAGEVPSRVAAARDGVRAPGWKTGRTGNAWRTPATS